MATIIFIACLITSPIVPAGYNECEIQFKVRLYEHTAMTSIYHPLLG
ncbi:MAG: hypothetical protein VX346_00155 [Planctomycetota bacterium]|nr:hypothetical protein [Planctomycetota bacterium]